MNWLDDNSRAIANWIWQELARGNNSLSNQDLNVKIEVADGGTNFVLFMPDGNSSNAVYVAKGGRVAQTECVELVGEFVMLMAGAQAVAFRQGCDRCEES